MIAEQIWPEAARELDAYSLESHRRAAGRDPGGGVRCRADQAADHDRKWSRHGGRRATRGIRYDASMEALAGLKTPVSEGRCHPTAGNASQILRRLGGGFWWSMSGR